MKSRMRIAAADVFVRARPLAVIFGASLLWLAISNFAAITDGRFTVGVIGLAAVAIVTYGVDARILNGIRHRGHLDEYGQTIGFCKTPTPGTSMIDCLRDATGSEQPNITGLYLQTCCFSNPYLRDFKERMVDTYDVSPDHVEIIGSGSDQDVAEMHDLFPEAEVFKSTDYLTEHFNLLQIEDRTFIWYEPYHDDRDQKTAAGQAKKCYRPKCGAFLVDVEADAVDAAFTRFNAAKAETV